MPSKPLSCALPALLLAASFLTACASVPGPPAAQVAELQALARRYVEAQFTFDPATLARVTAPQFVEVSPKGEVDAREAVLGFYAADRKTAAPPHQVIEQAVRLTGSTAVITQTLEMGSGPRRLRMTQALSASWVEGRWQLTSSQTTPVPPPRAP